MKKFNESSPAKADKMIEEKKIMCLIVTHSQNQFNENSPTKAEK